MSTVAEIEAAIEQLPPKEKRQLRERILKRAKPQPPLPIGKKLLALSGTIKDWPSDFAANHDHYLHGLPKRVP